MTSQPMTIAQALRIPGMDAVDARILLQHVLGVDHASLITHPERQLAPTERERFLHLCGRRRAGEPVAYLIGWREFYGRRFQVDARVLIPRPETELLIDLVLERIPGDRPSRLLDLGTGSGCIATTLALERRRCEVVAVDCDTGALGLAGINAAALGARNVEFRLGDWFGPLAGERFDVIVSNPPYVASGDPHLGQGDVRFEPRIALDGGTGGLDCIRRIVDEACQFLAHGGLLVLEHGFDQAAACHGFMTRAGYIEPFSITDLAGSPRVSGARAPARHAMNRGILLA